MSTSTITIPRLGFEIRPIRIKGERHQIFEVEFERGAVISCRSRRESEAMTARHLERARRNHVQDRIIAAIWRLPERRRKVAS